MGLGAIAGIRCMSPLALLAHQAPLHGVALRRTIFARPGASQYVKMLSLAELLIDKLPFLPSRTSLPVLLARLASGALVGATICGANDGSATKGAILGATGAFVSAIVTDHLRRSLTKAVPLSGLLIAVSEDTLAVMGGLFLLELLKEHTNG